MVTVLVSAVVASMVGLVAPPTLKILGSGRRLKGWVRSQQPAFAAGR
jgi:hypothetical protein